MLDKSAADLIGKVVILVFVFIDFVLFLVPTLMILSRSSKRRDYTLTAEATVIDLRAHNMDSFKMHYHNATPMYFPVYQYTINGQVYTHQSNAGTTKQYFKIGDRMKVLVDPSDHSKFILADSPGFKLATRILYATAAFLTIATIVVGIAI